ncbi:putative carotene-dioxygenase [Halteromyces radiatus]|uniref:putative carotene-dioxygenase n=1 Tax=Halteromyces radiatus TaxID=101107 RepID=UPI00221F4CC2|nr:putative carotene-dioxygenase [Halteromyces radiatus]KAI8089316.1 putative carotene-dioxygenase [Halteromyces radiatus]
MITYAENNPTPGQPAPSPVGFENVPVIETPIDLKVEGSIPSWVQGTMYRSGSGKYNILLDNGDTFHVGHPFDALAMLHRFVIQGNRVQYSSRHTSNGVERRIKAQDPTLLTFGPDPCKTIFGRMQSVYHHISNFGSNAVLQESDPEFDMVNVTITPNFPLGEVLENETGIKRGHGLVVKRDANTLQLVDSNTLQPLKMFTYAHVDKKIQGLLCASHHQYDETENEYVNFMVRLGPFPSFQPFITGPYLPNTSVSLDSPLPPPHTRLCEPIWRHLGAWNTMQSLKPSYIHSFSMTERYIIIPNFPYYYSFGGLSAIYYSCAYQTFYWDATRHTLFHVVDRQTGRHVATYDADPCFSFHAANAWDQLETLPGGQTERVIYMDYCMYENTDIIDVSFELGKQQSNQENGSNKMDGSKTKIDLDKVSPARYVHIKKHTDGKQDHAIAPSQVRRYRLGRVPEPTRTEHYQSYQWFSREYNQRRVASYQVLAYDVELPRFNPRYNLKPYRFLWGVCESRYAPSYASGTVVNGLIKVDLDQPQQVLNTDKQSTAKIWDEPGCSCAEPIFLPKPEKTAKEDEGVILSIVNRQQECFLLVLDASTMTELARTSIGKFNMNTIHGSFMDQHGKGVAVN